jgi:hypothetical protein
MKKTQNTSQTAVAPKPESTNLVPLVQGDIDSMSYNQLDGLVTDGCKEMLLSSQKAERKAEEIREILEPVIIKMHALLSNPGARTDLDPSLPTWEGWMEKHKAFYSRRAFYRILAKEKVRPPQVGDAYLTKDNEAAIISHLHDTAPDKVDVEIDLHDGNPPVTKTYNLDELKPLTPKPVYCAKTPHDWDVDVAISGAHKSVRLGDENNAIYWIKELYYTNAEGRCNINIWKQVHIYACEDIGLADMTVKTHILELELIAEKCKDNRQSDLMMVIEAVLICCRAKKSRAADNAIIWFNHKNPTYRPPMREEIVVIAKTNQPKPVLPDDSPIYDRHTAKGRQMGRKGKAGIEHFLKEGAKLENESSIPDFQAPVTVVHPENPFLTEGGL